MAGFDPDGIWDHDTSGQVYGPEPKPPEPEPYFDVEVKTRGLLGIKLVWEWEGQVNRRHKNLIVKVDFGKNFGGIFGKVSSRKQLIDIRVLQKNLCVIECLYNMDT